MIGWGRMEWGGVGGMSSGAETGDPRDRVEMGSGAPGKGGDGVRVRMKGRGTEGQ